MTDVVWHSFGVGPDFALLPLCYEMNGSIISKAEDAIRVTPVREDVTCKQCLEWMHA